jgi:hypothetical protein
MVVRRGGRCSGEEAKANQPGDAGEGKPLFAHAFFSRFKTRITLTQLANRRQPRYTAYSDRIIVAHLELSALLVAESGC